ncbi:MAG: hypothetical protein J3K34DRAFT_488936 [Monoraphidium minutum]|nr:MAG: hypothetical protein J3K34DRAFT_488936 [Monoraphidium minutum]
MAQHAPSTSGLLARLAKQYGPAAGLFVQLQQRTCMCASLPGCRHYVAPALSPAPGALGDDPVLERRASHHGAGPSQQQQRSLHSAAAQAVAVEQHIARAPPGGAWPGAAAAAAPRPRPHHYHPQQQQQQHHHHPQQQHPQLQQQQPQADALRIDEMSRQYSLQQDRLRSAAVEAAPAGARPALHALRRVLGLDAPALAALAAATARNARQLQSARAAWAGEAAAAALAGALARRGALSEDQVAALLTKCPALLRALDGADPAHVLDLLQRHAFPGAAAGEDAGASAALGALVVRAPHILRAPAAAVKANLEFLTGTLRLDPAAAAAALSRHPPLAGARPGALATNMGFLVGLGASGAELREMVGRCPRWAAMPLRDLTVKWQFIKQELKGTLEDVVLAPQLLQLSLLDALGPRAGLAKKKRVRLLMPSYSAGHPILTRPREWAVHRMAPVRFWMTASPERLGRTMGLDPEEIARYGDAWRMTTGDRWRRLVLSPGAGGGGKGGGSDAGAPLVTLPHGPRDDEMRAVGGGAAV